MGARVEVRLPSDEEIASLVGGEHDDVLAEMERIGRMVQAAKLGVIDHADLSARFLADGHRNSAAWTRAVTNCSPGESRRRVRAARTGPRRPVRCPGRAGRGVCGCAGARSPGSSSSGR